MKALILTLALLLAAPAFAKSVYRSAAESKIAFSSITQLSPEAGYKIVSAQPSVILTSPVKIAGKVFIGTDVGLYQIVQTRAGLKATVAFADCRTDTALPGELDCQGVEDLAVSPENSSHARIDQGFTGEKYDLDFSLMRYVRGVNAKIYYGSL